MLRGDEKDEALFLCVCVCVCVSECWVVHIFWYIAAKMRMCFPVFPFPLSSGTARYVTYSVAL